MQRADLLGKTLMLEKIEGKRRRGQQRMRWLDSISYSMGINLSKLWEIVKNREVWHTIFLGSGRSSGEGNGNPLQYSCLGNPTDRGAWRAQSLVHGVKELDTT